MKDSIINYEHQKNNINISERIWNTEFFPLNNIDIEEFANTAYLCCLSDNSEIEHCIMDEVQNRFNIKEYDKNSVDIKFVQYKTKTRMSGVNFKGNIIRKGEAEAIKDYFFALGHSFPDECEKLTANITQNGGIPVVIARNGKVMGVVSLTKSRFTIVGKSKLYFSKRVETELIM